MALIRSSSLLLPALFSHIGHVHSSSCLPPSTCLPSRSAVLRGANKLLLKANAPRSVYDVVNRNSAPIPYTLVNIQGDQIGTATSLHAAWSVAENSIRRQQQRQEIPPWIVLKLMCQNGTFLPQDGLREPIALSYAISNICVDNVEDIATKGNPTLQIVKTSFGPQDDTATIERLQPMPNDNTSSIGILSAHPNPDPRFEQLIFSRETYRGPKLYRPSVENDYPTIPKRLILTKQQTRDGSLYYWSVARVGFEEMQGIDHGVGPMSWEVTWLRFANTHGTVVRWTHAPRVEIVGTWPV